jgi:hypothetical protein
MLLKRRNRLCNVVCAGHAVPFSGREHPRPADCPSHARIHVRTGSQERLGNCRGTRDV